MKRILILPAVAAALMLTGCEGIPTPSVLSLEPAVTDSDTAPDVPLAGAWESSSSDQVCLIHKEKDGAFSIAYLSGDKPVSLKGRLFRAGDAMILELEPEGDDYFRISGHAFARVWLEGGTFRWAFLDSDWLKEQLKALPTYAAGDRTLLLAHGPAVRAFIEKAAADGRAVSEQVTWQRMQ
jgi:hypothetical protein